MKLATLVLIVGLSACHPGAPLIPTPEDAVCMPGEVACGDVDPAAPATVGCCAGENFCCGAFGYPGMCCYAGEIPEDASDSFRLNTPQIRRGRK
jgi:hypothetical protein